MEHHAKSYIPAAGSDWLLPLYDPIAKLMGLERVRRVLLDQAALLPRSRVLDIGCGTGSFCIMLKRLHPDVEIVGLDPDPKALARARVKAKPVDIQFNQGFSQALPFSDSTFDYIFSSMMFHHLELHQKEKTLSEVRRVLKPSGLFAMVDFAEPESIVGRSLTWLFHPEILRHNSKDRILTLMREAELRDAKAIGSSKLSVGRIVYYHGYARGAD